MTVPSTINDCAAEELNDYGAKWTTVGEAHTAANVTGEFSYGTSASSGFTLGESSSDSSGTFSADGTYTTSNGSTVGTPISAGSHVYVQGEFDYGNFFVVCNKFDSYYVVIPYWFTGGLETEGSSPTNPDGTCPPADSLELMPGNQDTVWYGSSTSYSTGVSILGFSFGVTESWTSQTTMQWTASAGAATTYLCGPGQSDPDGAAIVYDSAP
jgi:hypothetical protein